MYTNNMRNTEFKTKIKKILKNCNWCCTFLHLDLSTRRNVS